MELVTEFNETLYREGEKVLKTIDYEKYEGLKTKHSAHVVFRELTSGLYYVEKDRYDNFPEFVAERDVVVYMRGISSVLVIERNGKLAHANFDIDLYM